MLIRQKVVLSLLTQASEPLSRIAFVKLVFLLRQETGLQTILRFYDFVPYEFGPFSFTLYRDLESLRQNGYVTVEETRITLCERTLDQTRTKIAELSESIQAAVDEVVGQYARMNQNALINHVYRRYPWFAIHSKLPARQLASVQRPDPAPPAVYTVGYEGKSVEAFFNDLLKRGITGIIDVRANPISRKYGFSGLQLGLLCDKLQFELVQVATLGIPSSARRALTSFSSYQSLLDQYEQSMLPERSAEVGEVGDFMIRRPSALMCVEKDFRCCHRSRLANAVSGTTGLEVVHL